MSTLVIYSSKYGCTEKCAKLLANKLKDNVDLINLKSNMNIDFPKYSKIIIGGSIYMGKIQKEVTEFCSKYLNTLKDKSLGLFICGMQDNAIEDEINANFPQELLEIAKAKEYFGGEFIFEKMNFFEKIIVKKVSKITSNKSNILDDNIYKFAQVMNSV